MSHSVLLVDDDANLLYGLVRSLHGQPYRLHTARSGEEALHLLRTHAVDVIVVDEKMPGMSGCDVLAWVARNYPDVVAVVLTGYASTETAIRAVNEGSVYRFFTKPCNEARLATAICQAIEHRETLKEHTRMAGVSRRQSEDMKRFQQDLEVLSRVVSRDLESPLDAIARSCRGLLERYPDMLDPKAMSLADAALEAAGEVRRLTRDLVCHTRSREPLDPLADAGSAQGHPDDSMAREFH
jgi:two-component system, probable response regulator PhcQ